MPSPNTNRLSQSHGDKPEELHIITSTHISPEMARLRAAGFRLLLELGEPVDLSDLAAAAGLEPSVVEGVIEQSKGWVELDADGAVVGIAGLTVSPTRHQIAIGDDIRWTWCALDAIGILGALEASGTITSADPTSGKPIAIGFMHGKPTTDAAVFILGDIHGPNVRDDWCPNVNFFATTSAAQAWVDERQLAGEIVTISDVTDHAAAMWRPVTDSETA